MKLRIRPMFGGDGTRKRRARAAFTFAEVLAALVFMAIVIPVAMQGVQLANRAGVVAQRKGLAIQLANARLQEVLTYNQWENSGQSGEFPGWRGYRWRMLNQVWAADRGMRLITVQVSYLVQSQEYQVGLSTLIQDPNYR